MPLSGKRAGALADFERFDFLLDQGGSSAASVHDWIMDVDSVRRSLPDFDARNVAEVCHSGACIGRRGCSILDR